MAVVTGLGLVTDHVTDLSPLRALTGLTYLLCAGSAPGKGKLSDLSPLRGMALTKLNCGTTTALSDLSPLEGMPLTTFGCGSTYVSDLSPLRGTALTELICSYTAVSDLGLLKGMPLKTLYCNDTRVADLTPLQNCTSLELLTISNTKVTAAQVAALQKALPNCKIEWDEPAKAAPPTRRGSS